jgi:hypothetical protein
VEEMARRAVSQRAVEDEAEIGEPLSEVVCGEREEEWTEEEFPALDVDCRTDHHVARSVNCARQKTARPMDDLVDQILQTYELMRKIDAPRVENSREKIAAYLETLNSAGRLDAQQLAMYGLAYLKELHEGSDPRFTGC